MTEITLAEICRYRNETIPSEEACLDSYISTENMLPNKAGIALASSLPSTGNVRAYSPGDILVSNIRPYFKKIWRADVSGSCSNDILVFEPNNCDSEYLYWVLSSDEFFAYATATAKGTKMPRGDKKAVMNYRVANTANEMQKRIASAMRPIQSKIELNRQLNDYLV